MDNSQTPLNVKLQIINEKHKQLNTLMSENNIDCWTIFVRETATTPDSSMTYVVGNDVVGESAFVFHKKDGKYKKIAIVANYDVNTEKSKGVWDEVIGYEMGIADHLIKLVDEINPTKIALNYSTDDYSADGLTHGMFLKLSNLLPKHKNKFISAYPLVGNIRSNKSPTEVDLIQKACELTEEINDVMTKKIQIGQNELEIQKMFHQEVSNRGLGYSWQQSGNPAIDTGADKEFGHILPQSDRIIKQGNTLHNDFGVLYHGYGSDLQRMWFFGTEKDLPEELKDGMETIVETIQLAADNIKPGLKGYEIDQLARDYLKENGYGEYMHGLGHQVGITAHDGGCMLGPRWPRYGNTTSMEIKKGHVFTIEPNLKTKSQGMVSMEEMVVVTATGCEFLVPPRTDYIYME